MNAELAQHLEHGRVAQAVALQFDDDERPHVAILSTDEVEELQVGIDGEALGLRTVHKCDAFEVVANGWLQVGNVVPQVLSQEGSLPLVVEVHVEDLDAFLLRSAVVVLRLHLQELQVAAHIGAEAHLLAPRMPRLVDAIHRKVVGIEVGGVVFRQSLTAYVLRPIVGPCHVEELHELSPRRHKLCVDAVHELDATHLLERDRVECSQYVGEDFHTNRVLFAKIGG